ncbi:MAG: hypothetical protein LBO00_04265 [Zoogloeaceae bacterium]|nr:hypothetical protein [Zoogloeaceae bacterium]
MKIEQHLAVAEALQSIDKASDWISRQEECRKKFNLSEGDVLGGTCLYRDAGRKTVLLLGDSHASVSFDSIAEFNARFGTSTWMLHSIHSMLSLDQQKSRLEDLLKLIEPKSHMVSKVFIIERGVVRVEGKDTFDGEDGCFPLGEEGFYQRMQHFVDRLREMGKEVFIVAENPVLRTDIKDMIQIQPLRPAKAPKPESRADVLKHQEKYLNALKRVKGATIIHTLDAFCPQTQESCLLFDENDLPLYADDDHLSRWAGGRFLTERVLAPYLKP